MVFVLFSIDFITSLISVYSAPGVLLGLSIWSQSVFSLSSHAPRACEARALRARETLTLHLRYTKPILRRNPTVVQSTFPHFAFISLQERTMKQRGKRPV